MAVHTSAPEVRPRRASSWWTVAAVIAVGATIITAYAAYTYQQNATRPVGEGELFFADAMAASSEVMELFSDSMALSDVVRKTRNDLTIEGVAVVDPEGTVIAATSDNLLDTELTNPVLAYNLGNRSFGAVAGPITEPLSIDGVVEWYPGDVLYQAIFPLGDSGSLVLYYDVAELLGRRVENSGIQPETIQILGGAAFFAFLAAGFVVGRLRSQRRFRQLAAEAEVMQRQAAELEEYNAGLIAARQEAERALALAEEKIRIRAEFVLMINHELRTPLTSVVTGAELLRSGDLDEEQRRALLDDMILDGNRLHAMIADMLSVARIENRGLDYTLRTVTVDHLSDVLAAAHPKVAVEIGHTNAGLRRARVRTDPQTLGQLVASLADNAFNHGAGSIRVMCTSELPFEPMHQVGTPPTDAVHFVIIDDGPGIDPDFLPTAFEKFEKDSMSSGTGLGLYMASLMAEALDSSLAVHTTPSGTSIAVSIPRGGVDD